MKKHAFLHNGKTKAHVSSASVQTYQCLSFLLSRYLYLSSFYPFESEISSLSSSLQACLCLIWPEAHDRFAHNLA